MYKILLADDDFNIREPFTDFLTVKGFSVTIVKNGVEVVEKQKQKSSTSYCLMCLCLLRMASKPARK